MNHVLTPGVRAVAARTAKAAVVSVLGSFAFIAGWQLLMAAGFSPTAVITTTVACVLSGALLMAAGLRLADIRRPLVGGCYIAVLLAAYGAFFAFTQGPHLLNWAAWPAIAAHLGIIYALQQGSPDRPTRKP